MPLSHVVCAASSPKVDLTDSPDGPPWKQLAQPVYSLVTKRGAHFNANVVTYAIPCSVSPCLYAISIFKNTQTHDNLFSAEGSGAAVLQILGQQHLSLVPILGKNSGRDLDKMSLIQDMGFALRRDDHHDMPILADALGYIAVRLDNAIEAGDHDVAICSVVGHKKLSATAQALTSLDIRDSKVLENTQVT